METKLVEVRVRRADELRRWWLGGYPDRGVFLPDVTNLEPGTRVLVEVFTDEPVPSAMLLAGSVAWRQRAPDDPDSLEAVLPPGVGVRFEPSMHEQALFLEREMSGEAYESRRGLRFPADLIGEVIALHDVFGAEVIDVGPRGLRMRATHPVELEQGAAVAVSVAHEGRVVTLFAHVAWIDDDRRELGLCLTLETSFARMAWARVLMQTSDAAAFA